MDDAYFCWLVGLIGDEYVANNYQKLLWKLYVTDYIWELDYDKSRAVDGLYLRREYERNTGYLGNVTANERPCSILEMLIALARKAEFDIMHDPDFGDRSSQWFWTMLQNLCLDVYDDWHYFEGEVDRILDVFIHRRYERSGNGGAFPVRKLDVDWRKTDLWRQMNEYLEEHFPV